MNLEPIFLQSNLDEMNKNVSNTKKIMLFYALNVYNYPIFKNKVHVIIKLVYSLPRFCFILNGHSPSW